MRNKVYVTGVGIVSAVGTGLARVHQNLANCVTGIKNHAVDFYNISLNLPLGKIEDTDEQLKKALGINSRQTFSRTALLGMLAAREAWKNANLQIDKRLATGLVSATSIGGMDRGEIFYSQFLGHHSKGRLRNIIHHDCGDSTEKIADFLHIDDYITTISTACSSSANAIIHATKLIENEMLDRVVAGGSDALSNFTINGFRSLNILSDNVCMPFDKYRQGLNLGEGAGYLVLESEKSLLRSGSKPIARISGYANTCDAYHQTASSPDGRGAYEAMKQAIYSAAIEPNEVDYINAHGTATQNNDLSECKAIEKLFGKNTPAFSSTKSYTGHTLGAAGGVEAVISILSLMSETIFPTLNFNNFMEEVDIRPVATLKSRHLIDHMLSNSFGFGGNNSSILFSKC